MDVVVRVALPGAKVSLVDANRLFGAFAQIVEKRNEREMGREG